MQILNFAAGLRTWQIYIHTSPTGLFVTLAYYTFTGVNVLSRTMCHMSWFIAVHHARANCKTR